MLSLSQRREAETASTFLLLQKGRADPTVQPRWKELENRLTFWPEERHIEDFFLPESISSILLMLACTGFSATCDQEEY